MSCDQHEEPSHTKEILNFEDFKESLREIEKQNKEIKKKPGLSSTLKKQEKIPDILHVSAIQKQKKFQKEILSKSEMLTTIEQKNQSSTSLVVNESLKNTYGKLGELKSTRKSWHRKSM